jgi:hypothetical protein
MTIDDPANKFDTRPRSRRSKHEGGITTGETGRPTHKTCRKRKGYVCPTCWLPTRSGWQVAISLRRCSRRRRPGPIQYEGKTATNSGAVGKRKAGSDITYPWEFRLVLRECGLTWLACWSGLVRPSCAVINYVGRRPRHFRGKGAICWLKDAVGDGLNPSRALGAIASGELQAWRLCYAP